MKTIYFVRHGETEANLGKVFQGMHTKLNERGHEQAQVVAERCTKLPLDAMVVSAASRAQQTGEIIAKRLGISFETSDLFIERLRPKEIEDHPVTDENAARINQEWNRSIFEDGPRVGSGENFEDLKVRAFDALEYLRTHAAERVLVVTHGFFLRLLLATVLFGKTLSREEFKSVVHTFRTNNTGLSIFLYGKNPEAEHLPTEDAWTVQVWNDHAHLG